MGAEDFTVRMKGPSWFGRKVDGINLSVPEGMFSNSRITYPDLNKMIDFKICRKRNVYFITCKILRTLTGMGR